MKTKRLIVLLSILSCIVLIVVLSSTVFTIAKTELVFYNTPVKLSTLTSEQAKTAGKFKIGESVFFARKKEYTANLESAYPYIKVLAIETVFPNTMRVCALEREEVFAVSKTGGYLVCDSDFKVLRTGSGIYSSSTNNPILLTGLAASEFDNLAASGFIDKNKITGAEILGALQMAFYRNEKDTPALLALVKMAEVSGGNLVLKTFYNDGNGVEIKIYDAAENLAEKVNMALNVLGGLTYVQRASGQIVVFVDPNLNKIAGTYLNI